MTLAYIYARVSSSNIKYASNSHSINTQIDICMQYCVENDIDINRMYTDEGVSAGKGNNMKKLYDILEEMETGDLLVISTVDRLSRDIYSGIEFLKKLSDKGCNIFAVLDDINYSTDYCREEFHNRLSHAQRESERGSFRTKNGNIAKRKRQPPSRNQVRVITSDKVRPRKKQKGFDGITIMESAYKAYINKEKNK